MRVHDDSAAGTSVEIDEPAILIRISQLFRPGMSEQELYDTTRGIWKAHGARRDNARYAIAVYQGIIQEVYRIDEWYPAGTTSSYTRRFTQREIEGKWEFVGEVADEAVRAKYIGKLVAGHFSPHARNPIKYVNCTP